MKKFPNQNVMHWLLCSWNKSRNKCSREVNISTFNLRSHCTRCRFLTCIWADLNKQASVSAEDTLLLTQLALVLVGSMPHAITVERQKIAWAHINPKMKQLATEDYEKQEIKLYVSGFLEKASKRVEVKVSPRENPMPKRKGILNKGQSFENGKCDLRSFKSKGAPAQYGGRKN